MRNLRRMGMLVLALSLILSISMASAFAVETPTILETGTYRVSVEDAKSNNGMGFFRVTENKELRDFVIITSRDYGYIYLNMDNEEDYELRNVNLELISKEDLGVSGFHVYEIIEGQRDYDPIVDKVYTAPIGSAEDFIETSTSLPTSNYGVPSYGKLIDGVVYIENLTEEDLIEMFD